MRKLRIICQLFFFLGFTILFMALVFPFTGVLPVKSFLTMSPLIAIGTIISSRELYSYFGIATSILLLSVFLGRYFCGWICPLGTILDGINVFIKNKTTSWDFQLHHLKYWILVTLLVSAVFTLQLVFLLDPISMLTRTFTLVVYPFFNYLFGSTVSFTGQFDYLSDFSYTMQDKLVLFKFSLEKLSFRLTIFTTLLFTIIIMLEKVSRRFYCKNLCPLGALLGLFSFRSILRHVVSEGCTNCDLCRTECKMDAVSGQTYSTSPMECIHCFICSKICPPGIRNYRLTWEKPVSGVNLSRRGFLLAAGSGIVTTGLLKPTYLDGTQREYLVRPPGALDESRFLNRCIRCEACVKICASTGKGLQPAILESGWAGLWSPILVARTGYCEYNCNLCGKVCPTGAIRNLQLKEKKSWKIGLAFFDENRCIPLYKYEDCIVCEEHCPVPEKAIRLKKTTVVLPDGTTKTFKKPYVVEDICIGCGICVTKCPVVGKPGVYLTAASETRAQQQWINDTS